MSNLDNIIVAGGAKVHDREGRVGGKLSEVVSQIKRKITYISKIAEGLAAGNLTNDAEYLEFKKEAVENLIDKEIVKIKEMLKNAFEIDLVTTAQRVQNETIRSFIRDKRNEEVQEISLDNERSMPPIKSSLYNVLDNELKENKKIREARKKQKPVSVAKQEKAKKRAAFKKSIKKGDEDIKELVKVVAKKKKNKLLKKELETMRKQLKKEKDAETKFVDKQKKVAKSLKKKVKPVSRKVSKKKVE